MAFIEKDDLKTLYSESKTEANVWREQYPEYERLAENGLLANIDPSLPEVNDGSLSAALFKLPKRIVSSKLSGVVKAIDRDETWVSELANLVWQKEIIPYANSQAPFTRKWKDAVRKAAVYGSVPLITLFVETEGKRHADFIVGQPQDVTMEAGKVSDYDSDVMFWDIYLSKLQLQNMIEQAKAEQEDAKKTNAEGYNKWDVLAMKKILDSKDVEERSSQETPQQTQDRGVKPKGYHFCITAQKGKDAPFYMYHEATGSTVREWSNPDPTGDTMIHFLYCYQDFINPYGIGIVKLAGGTQNVLDYMRQADVLATQLGLEPPLNIRGDATNLDADSLVYEKNALWFTGDADVKREELSNGVYQQLPERMSMYKTSLNQLIPTGDTSIQAGSGDPNYSKTPAGVKFQQNSLSIDDEDFKDNLYVTYAAVAKSMINTHFANMEGSDLISLSDDEREILTKAGIEFPEGQDGQPTSQFEIQWDNLRATFDFEVEPEQDKATDDAQKLEGLLKVAELRAANPQLDADLASSGKKLVSGELFSEIIKLTTDNDKILVDVSPEDQAKLADTSAATGESQKPPKLPSESLNYKDAPEDVKRQIEAQAGLEPSQMISPVQEELEQKQQQLDQAAVQAEHGQAMDVVNAKQAAKDTGDGEKKQPKKETKSDQAEEPAGDEQAFQANIDALMEHYGIDEQTAATALLAEEQGAPIEDIIAALQQHAGGQR